MSKGSGICLQNLFDLIFFRDHTVLHIACQKMTIVVDTEALAEMPNK